MPRNVSADFPPSGLPQRQPPPFPVIPFKIRRFLGSAALRREGDFGKVPPIWGRPFGQGRPPFYAPAALAGKAWGDISSI